MPGCASLIWPGIWPSRCSLAAVTAMAYINFTFSTIPAGFWPMFIKVPVLKHLFAYKSYWNEDIWLPNDHVKEPNGNHRPHIACPLRHINFVSHSVLFPFRSAIKRQGTTSFCLLREALSTSDKPLPVYKTITCFQIHDLTSVWGYFKDTVFFRLVLTIWV